MSMITTRVARRLGRPTSTVSREVAAGGGRHNYRATAAERRVRGRRCRPKERKLVSSPALAARVSEGLEQRWPPGQIATRLAREFPDDAEMRVSHETHLLLAVLPGPGRAAQGADLRPAIGAGPLPAPGP